MFHFEYMIRHYSVLTSDGVGPDLDALPFGHVRQGPHVVVNAVALDVGERRLLPFHFYGCGGTPAQLHVSRGRGH